MNLPLRSDVLVIFTASSSSSGTSSFLFCAKIAFTLNLRKGFVASEATTSGLLHEGVGDMLSLRSHLTSASFNTNCDELKKEFNYIQNYLDEYSEKASVVLQELLLFKEM